MNTVNYQLVEVGLERADDTSFERFAQAFFAGLTGQSFVPLGGVRDGGADALSERGLFQAGPPDHFWQALIQATYEAKIRNTTRRLREFGRVPKQLTYCTSRIIPTIDVLEDRLGAELDLRLRIRDQKYIVSHINASPATVEAFNSYLAPQLVFLQTIGGTSTIQHAPPFSARALCVFLGQEVERRRGNTDLLEALTDSLILWALENADPEFWAS